MRKREMTPSQRRQLALRSGLSNGSKSQGRGVQTPHAGKTASCCADGKGLGLLTSDGEPWRRPRRLAQPAFQLGQIQKYSDIMVSLTEQMLRLAPGQTRDVHVDMMRLTLEIVGRTLFGTSVEGKAEIVGHAMEVIMRRFAESPRR